jgi:crotonobetainyl-CoA:carnitine CoA-transferase CaiB-like acyl-CoA transferase
MAGALDGVRVIDFGQYIAGPMTGMLLADQGADVIKVDPPGGPVWDSPANATYNRGKRSVVLDLKQPGDTETARRLVAAADVVIENFRPGVMDRLGLGAEAMLAANPRLVYCSLPGFAADDPRRDLPAWEGVVAAATGTYRPNPGSGRPVYTAVPISSVYAAFQAAVAIAMALNARERDGLGQLVQVPLFDGTFAAIGGRGLRVHNAPEAPLRGMAAMMGWTRQFQCADGRWVMFHAGNKNFPDFLRATGATDWAGDFDPSVPARTSGQNVDPARVEALFRTRPAHEWEAFAEKVGTECAVCRTSAEWLDNEHARASQIVVETQDPKLGRLVQPGINVRMSLTPGAIRGPAPLPGQHQAEVAALSPTRGEGRRGSRPPSPLVGEGPGEGAAAMRAALEGVRVIDLCIVLAGPTCGRTLAEFGADVIKIDSPHRPAVAFHNDINRAKRSIVLDLKKPEGMEVFWKLVDTADVVVQNFRKGVADRLGFGYEAVRARKPDIVYASLNTYGQVGPYADRPGHEQIAQAATGMQERFGGDGRPVLQPFAVNDYGTGFMGAYGVALALLHRQKTGQGQHVDTALAYTATMLQSPFLQSYEGKKWDEPRGQQALGSGPLHRAYQCADGWLFLGAKRADLPRLESATGERGYAGMAPAELEAALERCFRAGTVAEWVSRLAAAGIGAHRVLDDVAELMTDPWVQAHGLSITRDHDGFGPITTTGPSPRLSRTPPAPGRPAPRPGSDAASVLADIGLQGELDALVASGVVRLEGITAR